MWQWDTLKRELACASFPLTMLQTRKLETLQAGNLLLVLAHGDSVVKGCLGRRDTLLAMFEVMRRANVATLLKCLKCLKLLTFDPALLQPLQVSQPP